MWWCGVSVGMPAIITGAFLQDKPLLQWVMAGNCKWVLEIMVKAWTMTFEDIASSLKAFFSYFSRPTRICG